MNENGKYVLRQLGIIFLVLVIGVLLFTAGLVIGFGGDNPWSILSPSKWQEIIGKFTGQ